MKFLLISIISVACLTVFSPAFADNNPVTDAARQADNIKKGQSLASDRNRGNCLSCHMTLDAELPGNIGPPLIQMKIRYPDRNKLHAQIYDAREKNPQTVMPPYGAHGILSDEEVELVVDYVYSL